MAPKKQQQQQNGNANPNPNRTPPLPVTGRTQLPVSKVSKIIKADKDITISTKEATFLISVTTEHFIRRLTDAAYTRARLDGRKVVTYKDLATVCLPQVDDVPSEFFFLEEVIPKPIPLSKALEVRKKRVSAAGVPFISKASHAAGRQHAEAQKGVHIRIPDLPVRIDVPTTTTSKKTHQPGETEADEADAGAGGAASTREGGEEVGTSAEVERGVSGEVGQGVAEEDTATEMTTAAMDGQDDEQDGNGHPHHTSTAMQVDEEDDLTPAGSPALSSLPPSRAASSPQPSVS